MDAGAIIQSVVIRIPVQWNILNIRMSRATGETGDLLPEDSGKIPLIFILPLFLSNKVFAVFLAEPVSDILAAAITTITFLSRFNGILNPKDLSSPDIR